MPYKFGEYVSTYVDPQSVKISETLRNRFVSNLQANDQLAMTVDQMQAASVFENDVQRKKELQRVAENTLGQLAESGDYENQGMPIRKAAIDFTKEYAPIQENYKRYSTYVNEFNEALKKGDYNPEQQKLLSQYMLRTANGPYKGFEIDQQTGKVKEGSLFSGPTIYKDPKIMDRVTERLKILHEEKTGSTVQKVGQGADGSLTIESGGTISKIDPAKVQQVVDAVMAEADVKAYVEQLADMKTYSFQASGQLPQVFNAQLQGYTDAVQKINEALDGGGLSSADRAALKGQLTTYTQELNKLKEASQDENLMYSYVKSKAQDEIEAPVRQFASFKGGIYEQTSVYKESYDALWMDEYKRKKDFEEANGVPMEEMSSVNATMYGNTVEEQKTTAKNYTTQAESLENEAKDYTISQTVRQQKLQQAQALRNKANMINQNIVKAGNMSFSIDQMKKQDPTLIGVLHAMYPTSSAGELALMFQRTFDNPKDQDFIDFKNKFEEMGNGKLSDHLRKYYATAVFGDDPDGTRRFSYQMDAVKDKFSFVNDEDVDIKLKEIKIATPLQYGVLPAMTDKESRMVTNAANAYFKGKPLPANVSVVDEQTGKTLSGAELNTYSTATWSYDAQFNDWVLVMQGSGEQAADRKTVRLSGDQVTSKPLVEYQSSPAAKFSHDIMLADTGVKGEVREFTKNAIDESGNRTDGKIVVRVHSQGSGSQPLIEIVSNKTKKVKDSNGNEIEVPIKTDKHYASEPTIQQVVLGYQEGSNGTQVPLFEW
jgi:ribosomal protein S18